MKRGRAGGKNVNVAGDRDRVCDQTELINAYSTPEDAVFSVDGISPVGRQFTL